MNLKLGLKLWSTNKNYINEAIKLFKDDIYNHIELYVVPDSYEQYINIWSDLKIPFIIHATHFKHGLNLAEKKCQKKNLQLIKEVQQFADKLNADKIIVHLGINGDIREASRQIKIINDSRILIENMPCFSLIPGLTCNGAFLKEIKYIIDNNKIGFCLDMGHAICAANAQKIKPMDSLKKLLKSTGFKTCKIKTIISELSVLSNYLNCEDPYLGSGKPEKNLLGVLTEKQIHNNLLGYKIFLLAEKENK